MEQSTPAGVSCALKHKKKRLQDETDRWKIEKQILLSTIYGTTADVAKGQDINEVKLVDTTPPWDSQKMLTISKQKPCKNGTKLSQMKKDMRNKTVYITIEPQTEEMELTHYGHATIEEIPVLMQEDKCKLNVEKI